VQGALFSSPLPADLRGKIALDAAIGKTAARRALTTEAASVDITRSW
jgi:hypothetical protein